MQLLERFRAKLDQAEQTDILFDKSDANLRDEAKSDWYDLSDPRHPINKRKRGEI
ncbi:unnamed protein product, partial [Mesorhabditis belari]|uniref:Uncharacterized protein n=1 Tax=Mesorhabditis belari TaxID=2138241 RepID=A0AAF3EMF8_9BILA